MIPCSGGKLDQAPADRFYTGPMFRHTLAAAQAAAGRSGGEVLILSALHGLVTLPTVIKPYDVRMGDPESVTAPWVRFQARVHIASHHHVTVHALLPRAYLAVLAEALQELEVPLVDLYAGARGIGDQRAVNARLLRAAGS